MSKKSTSRWPRQLAPTAASACYTAPALSPNQDGTEGSTAPGAIRRKGAQREDAVDEGSNGDGTAPDQRSPDHAERSDENRGSNRPDTTEPATP